MSRRDRETLAADIVPVWAWSSREPLYLAAFIALAGGALATTILLTAGGLALAITGALRHARSMDG